MDIEFDSAKDRENIRKHGVSLAMAKNLNWDMADCHVDCKYDYGELRMSCFAFLGAAIYYVTYTPRGDVFRIISLRKATKREERIYERILGIG